VYVWCVQWSLTNDRWYSVNPPPIEDRRHKFPNEWKDPNYDGSPDHLYMDYAYSAATCVLPLTSALPLQLPLPSPSPLPLLLLVHSRLR
jgi:hypothetical protein